LVPIAIGAGALVVLGLTIVLARRIRRRQQD
jgi:hypothetical protein